MWIRGCPQQACALPPPSPPRALTVSSPSAPPSRWSGAAQRGGEPVQDLHGLAHRLCSPGVWPHGHLHQVRQAHERVSHLPAVRDPGRARLPILRAGAGFFSALQGRSWKGLGSRLASLQRGRLTREPASKDAVTSGHACPASVRSSWPAGPGAWELVRSHGQVPVPVILG